MNERAGSFKTRVGLVLLLAFGLRLSAAIWWDARLADEQRFAFGDSESYWVLAERIASGKSYEYGVGGARAFRTPGYPLVLALLFAVDDSPAVMWARSLGACFGTLAVGGVIWITQQLFTRRAALVAGLLAALYPGAIGMSVFVLSEAPFCPLMLAQLAAWIAAFRAASSRRAAWLALLAGLLAGLATLVRPSWLLFTPFAWAIAITCFAERKRQLLIGVALAVGIVTAMLPWWVRNHQVTGALTLTTTQLGASLYDGWNAQATGASDMRFVDDFFRQQQQADAAGPQPPTGAFEVRLDKRMRDAAVRWAKSDPGRVVQLAAIKFARMWSPWPNAAEFQSWLFRLVICGGYLPLSVLSVGGAVRFARHNWPAALCAIPAVYFTCLHVIFVSSIRYRQPAMLVLIVLAAGLIDTWWTKKTSSDE